jgi:LPS sulfotransferase NodH
MSQAAASPTRGYLICCIERTGSNLLTGALMRTGKAGLPREYFNHSDLNKPWMREILGDADLIGGFPRILAAGTTPNGIFGAKIHLGHFRRLGTTISGDTSLERGDSRYRLLSSLAAPPSPGAALELLWSHFADLRWQSAGYDFLRARLPDLRFIWLTRRNMAARAISLIRARRTGRWWKAAATTAPADDRQDFDLNEIHIRYCIGLFEEALWQRFFEDNGIVPHPVTYETFVPSYEATVSGVLTFLDIDIADAAIAAPSSAIQSDSLSTEWEERYRTWSAQAGFDLPPVAAAL